jgi:hypothetical protein
VKNLLPYKLFEQIYLNDVNPFSKESKHPRGLRFVNKQEALNSIRRIQSMLDKKEIEIKDAIIASYIMSQRAEFHKFPSPGIKEGMSVWKNFLSELKKKENISS